MQLSFNEKLIKYNSIENIFFGKKRNKSEIKKVLYKMKYLSSSKLEDEWRISAKT